MSNRQNMVAKIVDNNDPKQMGRVKCRIPLMHDGVSDSDLPWCNPQVQSTGKGSSDIPSIGEEVFVTFPNGDAHEPIYMGNVQTSQNLHPALKTNYPNRKGYASEFGFVFYRDETDGSIFFSSPNGVTFFITGSDLKVITASSLTVEVGGMSCVVDGSGINITGGDVVADGISLKTHRHGGIASGSSNTSTPI